MTGLQMNLVVGKVYDFVYKNELRRGRLLEVWPKAKDPYFTYCNYEDWRRWADSVNTLTFATTEGIKCFYDGAMWGVRLVPWYVVVWMYMFGNLRHYLNLTQKVK